MLRRRKLLENGAESPASGARFVRWLWVMQDSFAWKQNHALNWLDFTRTLIFYKPDFVLENTTDLPNRQSRELAKTFAEYWLCEKFTLPEKINLAEKPEPNKPILLLKPWSQFWEPDLTKENASQKKQTTQNETACLPKLWLKILKPILEAWASLRQNYLNKNHERILKPIKFWKLPPLKTPEFIEPDILLKAETLICKTQNANLWPT